MTNFLAYSTEVPGEVAGRLMYGLEVTIIGILIVFAVLVLIMLVIYMFQLIFGMIIPPRPHTNLREMPVKSPACRRYRVACFWVVDGGEFSYL